MAGSSPLALRSAVTTDMGLAWICSSTCDQQTVDQCANKDDKGGQKTPGSLVILM